MAEDDCGQCKRPVTNNCNGVQCEPCRAWYHVNCGVMRGLKPSQLKVLESKAIFFICKECREEVKREWRRKKRGGRRRARVVDSDSDSEREEAAQAGETEGAAAPEVETTPEVEGAPAPEVESNPEVEATPEVMEVAGDHTYHLDGRRAREEVEREREVVEEPEEQPAAAAVVLVQDPDPPLVRELFSFPRYGEEEEGEETVAQETREAAAAVGGTREEVVPVVGTRAAAETEVGDATPVVEEEAAAASERGATAADSVAGAEETVGTGEATVTEASGTETQARSSQGHTPWVGVGTYSWQSIMRGRRMEKRPGKRKRRVWLFGDSILRGVGERIDFHTAGYYEVADRTQGGATIHRIRDIVQRNLNRMKPEDMVVLEGGGNGLEVIGERETVRVVKEIVETLKAKVGEKVLLMCVPRRRVWEGTVYDRKRRWLNAECLTRLEEWGCDGLRLLEEMSWSEVWAKDELHLSHIGKAWAGWNIVEWARQRERRRE